jgi:hypothetical protein
MRRVLTVAAAIFCASPLVAGVLDSLGRNDVRVYTRLRDVDASALAALKRQFDYGDRRLADRGAEFEATDMIEPEKNLPERRLVFAARVGGSWFFHYEHGGRGYHSHLVGLTRSDHSWRRVYAGTDFRIYETLSKLRAAVRAHHFEKTYDL